MNKQILFCRHAEAEPGLFGHSDHDRKLTQNGIQKSKEMARVLRRNNIYPDFYISSSARRTLETCKIIKGQNQDSKVQVFKEIYTDNIDGIALAISSVGNNYKVISIFGHNPALNEIYKLISNNEYLSFPTSGIFIARLDLPNWRDFNIDSIYLEKYFDPNSIKSYIK